MIGRRIVGDSPAMRHLLDTAAPVAGKDITGRLDVQSTAETGTTFTVLLRPNAPKGTRRRPPLTEALALLFA